MAKHKLTADERCNALSRLAGQLSYLGVTVELRRANRIDNLHIVRKQIEVDPLPTFCGGTDYDREHQYWVIGFYCIMGAIGAGWLIAWMIGRAG